MRNNFSWGRAAVFFALSAFGLFLAIFLADAFLLPFWEGKFSSNVAVPDLSGLDSAGAADILRSNGLRVAEPVSREFNESVPAGRVVSQVPAAGHEVKRKRRIRFVLSLGEEMVTVPSLQDLSPVQAVDTLQRLGLRIGDIREVFDPHRSPGAIIASTPAAGTSLPRGRTVNLLVSQSGGEAKTQVPDLRNASLTAASKSLRRADLLLRRTLKRAAPDLVPGTVLEQSLPPGSQVNRGTPIDLTVSE